MEETQTKKVIHDTEAIQKVIKTLNVVLEKAIRYKASDIHIEPGSNEISIRYRVDGRMVNVGKIDKSFYGFFISRIKVMAGMDISEKRIPQDGRMSLEIDENPFTFRVATLPSLHGENIVIRILDQSAIYKEVKDLGFPEDTMKRFTESYTRSNGIILVTGPTGSGKTTTLYAVLNELNDGERNIISIENPVEYELKGITQSQINTQTGMTFALGLRAMLRLDPDVLMVGEIRDAETAKVAIEAAMTGHLVLSTLHTNDASSAAIRMIEMGIEPFLVSNSMRAVLAQRLVRKLCEYCKEDYTVDPDIIDRIISYRPEHLKISTDPVVNKIWDIFDGKKAVQLCRPKGCVECNFLGFKGRKSVYELFSVDDDIEKLIVQKASSHEIRKAAYERGMRTLFEDGLRLVIQQETSIEEIFRALV